MYIINRSTSDISINLPPLTYIYKITCEVNDKSYIGRTGNIKRRIEQHLTGDGSKLLLYDFVEFGRSNFTFDIVDMTTGDNLNEIEDKYINKYNSLTPFGYNQCLNCVIVPQPEVAVNLNEIKISAKYNFLKNNKFLFSVGELSNARSYQTLTNVQHYLHSIDCENIPMSNKTKKFNYIQLLCECSENVPVAGSLYSLILKYSIELNELEIIYMEQL